MEIAKFLSVALGSKAEEGTTCALSLDKIRRTWQSASKATRRLNVERL